jgi:hypothetical protein
VVAEILSSRGAPPPDSHATAYPHAHHTARHRDDHAYPAYAHFIAHCHAYDADARANGHAPGWFCRELTIPTWLEQRGAGLGARAIRAPVTSSPMVLERRQPSRQQT